MAGAAGNQLPPGYDEDFVNAVEDEFLCLICHLTLKELVLTRCGHRLLRGAFKKVRLFVNTIVSHYYDP